MADTVYEFSVEDCNGKDFNMSDYQGYVLIIVNVASEDENTERDYEQLQELYEKYQETGLRILAFPCDQIDGKEPKSNAAIRVFARKRGAKFTICSKVDVNGDTAIPLYDFIKNHPNVSGEFSTEITSNFTKFVVDRFGKPRRRFPGQDEPKDMTDYIEMYLSQCV